jgi:hypothetical protein
VTIFDDEIKVYQAGACIDDAQSMSTLLAPLKNAAELLTLVREGRAPFYNQNYDRETRTARYAVCDGTMMLVYTLTNVSLAEAAAVGARCQGIREWSYDAFSAAVDLAFGEEFQRVQ